MRGNSIHKFTTKHYLYPHQTIPLLNDLLILVDQNDQSIGTADKQEVHSKGLLHRAFSIFIFNKNGELLLQRRALSKYHSGGLWSNTCCGHPLHEESTADAASRRLNEEMNLKTELKYSCSFQYKTTFENGLIENEIDHVFYGVTDQLPELNPYEAIEWKYIVPAALVEDVNKNPDRYTYWLKICIDQKVFDKLI